MPQAAHLNASNMKDNTEAMAPIGNTSNYMFPHQSMGDMTATTDMELSSGLPAQQSSALGITAPYHHISGDRFLAPSTIDSSGQGYFQSPPLENEIQNRDQYALPANVACVGRFQDKGNNMTNCHQSPPSNFSDFKPNHDNASRFSTAQSVSSHSSHSSNSSSRSLMEQMNRYSSSSSTQSPNGYIFPRKDSPVTESATIGSRIESAIQAIRTLGFGSIDDLAAQYYTANLEDRPVVAHSQRISRRRGLTSILSSIRKQIKNNNWSDWEARGFLEEAVRTAEDVLEDEFYQFSKSYGREINPRGTMAELKELFQEEVRKYSISNLCSVRKGSNKFQIPNLYSLLGVLSLSGQQQDNTVCTDVNIHAINTLLYGSSKM